MMSCIKAENTLAVPCYMPTLSNSIVTSGVGILI
jgi:hypothetical protein